MACQTLGFPRVSLCLHPCVRRLGFGRFVPSSDSLRHPTPDFWQTLVQTDGHLGSLVTLGTEATGESEGH